jgi:hypothetical protein
VRAFKELRFYSDPEAIGYEASIETTAGCFFIKPDGTIVGPYLKEAAAFVIRNDTKNSPCIIRKDVIE